MDGMINKTKEVKGGSVMGSTLSDMDKWDVNKLNGSGRDNKK